MTATLYPTPAPPPLPPLDPMAPSPITAPPAGTGMMFSPNAAANPPPAPKPSNVDFGSETVEGRIGNLLKTDQKGNYTSDVVRQAVDRQEQAFNARGLLNSSMAMQAGQEAAISKAADIAAADANTYAGAAEKQRDRDFSQTTRLDEQDFQLRGDYQKGVQAVNTNFQKMVDTINASSMTPGDKSVAIAQAQSVRDGELAYQNNLYSNMPRWKNEWLALAVPSEGVTISAVNNRDTLANIANDPAQTAERRQAARDRLAGIDSGAIAPAAAPAGSPANVDGSTINWSAPNGSGGTLKSEYDAYKAKGGTLSPEMYYMITRGGAYGAYAYGDGTGNGNTAASSDGGIGGGMSA